jgi:hypothetical protein
MRCSHHIIIQAAIELIGGIHIQAKLIVNLWPLIAHAVSHHITIQAAMELTQRETRSPDPSCALHLGISAGREVSDHIV